MKKKIFLFLGLIFFILCFIVVNKNIYNAINTDKKQTKILIFNKISYDIYSFKLFNGEFKKLYDNGNIQRKMEIKNGKLNGEIIEYYNNGIIKFIGNYSDNKMADGCVSFYYQNGNLSECFCYKDNKQDGNQMMFYDNGNIKLQAFLQKGKLIGIEKIFRENGTLLYEIDNDNALIKEFDEKGNFIGTSNAIKTQENFKKILKSS